MLMTEQIRNLLSNLMEADLEFKVVPSMNTITVDEYNIIYKPDTSDFKLFKYITPVGRYTSTIELVMDLCKDI